MAPGKITAITIEGMRTFKKARIAFDGLTVLIGENGTGKSTVLEALEILAQLTTRGADVTFARHFLGSLLRHGSESLTLTVELADANGEDPMTYSVTCGMRSGRAGVVAERLQPASDGTSLERGTAEVHVTRGGQISRFGVSPGDTSLTIPFENFPAVARVRDALRAIHVVVPFEVSPQWATWGVRQGATRASNTLRAADGLERWGANLANAFLALRSERSRAHWDETLDFVRLGLGGEIEDIYQPIVGDGQVSFSVKFRGVDQPIPAKELSDGQLAFLGFVAMFRLRPSASLLALDEPEAHFHPGLLARVMGLLSTMTEDCPVLLTTHSDAVLNYLTDPAKSVRVCEIGAEHETVIRELDPEALEEWRDTYSGLGALRRAGHVGGVTKAGEAAE